MRRQRAAAGAKKASKGPTAPQADQPRKPRGRGQTYHLPRRRRPRPQGRWAAVPPRILRGGPDRARRPRPLGARGSNRAEKTASRGSARLAPTAFLAGASRLAGPKNSRLCGLFGPAMAMGAGAQKETREGQKQAPSQRREHGRAGEPPARPPRAHTALSPRGYSAAGIGRRVGGFSPPMAADQLCLLHRTYGDRSASTYV